MDTTDAPIQGAQIEFRSPAGIVRSAATKQDISTWTGVESGGTLVVTFPGFATVTREIRAHSSAENLQIVLAPAASLQRIEVQERASIEFPPLPTQPV